MLTDLKMELETINLAYNTETIDLHSILYCLHSYMIGDIEPTLNLKCRRGTRRIVYLAAYIEPNVFVIYNYIC